MRAHEFHRISTLHQLCTDGLVSFRDFDRLVSKQEYGHYQHIAQVKLHMRTNRDLERLTASDPVYAEYVESLAMDLLGTPYQQVRLHPYRPARESTLDCPYNGED